MEHMPVLGEEALLRYYDTAYRAHIRPAWEKSQSNCGYNDFWPNPESIQPRDDSEQTRATKTSVLIAAKVRSCSITGRVVGGLFDALSQRDCCFNVRIALRSIELHTAISLNQALYICQL